MGRDDRSVRLSQARQFPDLVELRHDPRIAIRHRRDRARPHHSADGGRLRPFDRQQPDTSPRTLLAVLNVNHGLPIGVAIAAALAAGLAIGLVNGFFVLYFRMNSLIVTMGVGTFAHGLTLWLGDQQTISGVSEGLVDAVIVDRLSRRAARLLLCADPVRDPLVLLSATPTAGRRLLFVGRGREVARLSGIAVDRVRLGGFASSGLLGAIAGVLYVGTTGAADPSSGLTFLLPAFAAAFLGATSINPGRFNPWGTIISVYFLVTGITGLSILGVSTFVQDLFYGGALVIAVTLVADRAWTRGAPCLRAIMPR